MLEEIRIAHPEMDSELYHKIYLYLKTLKIIHKDKDKELLLESLPYNLKYSILYQMNKPLIEGLNFFKNLSTPKTLKRIINIDKINII